jgi:hypothetical protein
LPDDPGRTSAWLDSGQYAARDQPTHGGRADVQDNRGLIDRRLTAFGAFARPVDGDVILMT